MFIKPKLCTLQKVGSTVCDGPKHQNNRKTTKSLLLALLSVST